ncbi:MAG: hypothetical protein ACLFTK_16170 [Anaerolineales bacterium]
MANISIMAAQVRPLNGAIVRRFIAGGAVSAGDAVYIHTDGTVLRADADAVASAQARGIVVGVGTAGAADATTGDAIDVVTHGPVALGTSDLTDGAVVYTSTTAGALNDTAPTGGPFPFVVGWAESPTVLYVAPQTAVPEAST